MVDDIELILEGGGMRGVYTSGVLDFFLEKEIYFKNVVGVSAGLCNGLNYCSRQIGRQKNIYVDYSHNKEYISFTNYIKTGSLFGFDYLLNKLSNEILPFDYQAFKESNSTLIGVITNMQTGLAEYKVVDKPAEQTNVIQASCSLPLVSVPVTIEDSLYMDGGMADPIPVRYSQGMGFKKQVVILTRYIDYKKGHDKFIKVKQMKYKKYPQYVKTLKNRPTSYNETLDYVKEMEQEGKFFVIRPSEKIEIDKFSNDKAKLEYYYNLGYNDASKRYEELLNFIK